MRIQLVFALLAAVPLVACVDRESPTAPVAEGLAPSLSLIDYSTPQTIITGLIEEVGELVLSGTLSNGEGNALSSKLENALKSLEKGNLEAFANQLEAFVNQVEALMRSKRLAAEGQHLIDTTRRALARLEGKAIAVDAGESFTCALDKSGQAFCWGRNHYGQLGNGTYADSPVPVAVAGEHVFVSIALGTGHACGLTGSGTAFCWGANTRGELGADLGPGTTSPVPVEVLGDHSFRQLSGGNFLTCGLTFDGAAFCWGMSRANGLPDHNPVPHAIGNPVPFVSVGAGSMKACGLTAEGAVYCWGLDRGDFGNGTTSGIFLSPVPAASGVTFRSLYVGTLYTCGIKSDGSAFCWGSNRGGKLGLGTVPQAQGEEVVPTPTPVAGGLAFATLDLNATNWLLGHTCGVTTGGLAYCWGTNAGGELGSPSSDLCQYSTVGIPCSASPLPAAEGITFTFVASGNGLVRADAELLPKDAHSCGLATDGMLYCWGSNQEGQLGNGTYVSSITPVKVGF